MTLPRRPDMRPVDISAFRRKVSLRVRDLEGSEDPWDLWWPKPERGKSSMIAGRIDMDASEAIDALIAHREGPWQTRTEFLVCAVGYYLALVNARLKRNKMKTSLKALELHALAARAQRPVAQVARHLKDVSRAAGELWRMGLVAEARATVQGVLKEEWDDAITRTMVKRWSNRAEIRKILVALPGPSGTGEGE